MSDVDPIPNGFRSVTPYMVVPNSVEAIAFYEKAFGATLVSRMDGPGGSTMHAEIRIGDSMVMMTDENPEWGIASPRTLGNNSGSLHLYVADVDSAFQKAVEAGCEVVYPVAQMFWGDRFGKLKDPFGHTWSMATKVEQLTAEQITERAEEMRKQMESAGSCAPGE